MAFKIKGFGAVEEEQSEVMLPLVSQTTPCKCLVQVYFPHSNQTLTYFNDQFNLKDGDIVFVEGKMELKRGIVKSIQKNFKIKIADYKKIVSVADTDVTGKLHFTETCVLSFDTMSLPYAKIRSWVLPPQNDEDIYETGSDESSFLLDKLFAMDVTPAIFERGKEYFFENRVTYVGIAEGRGKAIVEGEHAYELDFDYADGEIRHLTCSCPCGYTCKHEVAAMFQLREILEDVTEYYAEEYKSSGCVAAVAKAAFFSMVLHRKKHGSIAL